MGGGIWIWWRFYILQTIISPPIFSKFEHEIGSGGGSGDGGGSLSILIAMSINNKNTDSLMSGIKVY